MNDTNRIVVCKENFESEEEFENAIKRAIMVLLENDYIMTVKYDEKGLGIVCIDYDIDNYNLCGYYPFWLTVDEIEFFENSKGVDNEMKLEE